MELEEGRGNGKISESEEEEESDPESHNEKRRLTREERESTSVKQKTAGWILKHIKKRECTTFVGDSSRNGTRCQCGRLRNNHLPVALDDSFNTAVVTHWDSAQHSSEYPTDAFGRVSFVEYQWCSYFLRLSSDTDPSIVYDLMTTQWGLQQPNLVVSVMGGKVSAKVKIWVQEVLRQGLVKTLQSKGAWILTEGLHERVGRCVGEAVRDLVAGDFSDNSVVALGIAPWGLLHNRHRLVYPQGWNHIAYYVENTTGVSCCLANNYDPFLLVDDGSVGRRGGEMNFRAMLEDYISHQHIRGTSIDIPVLCMLMSGEATMLEWVALSLRNSIPWLVLAGSGGVADLLSDILEKLSSDPAVQSSNEGDGTPGVELKDRVAERVRRHFPSEAQTDKLVEWALSIYQNRDLITVYHGEQERLDDFDRVMLKTLLQVSKRCVSHDASPYTEELKRALTWKSVDFAKSELFNGDINWTDQDLEDCMTDALVTDKPQFVRLFIENGFNIVDYLTCGRLEKLYSTVSDDTLAYKLLQQGLEEREGTQGGDISLFQVSRVLEMLMGDVLMGDEYKPFYSALSHASEQPCEFAWPSLFIWAVLQNRSEMAVFFWEKAEEPVMSALSACKMLREMSKMDCETGITLSMKELAQKFEKLAHDMFSSCYQSDEKYSFSLLTCESPVWGTTCLQMGMAADARLFFSHDGVQSKLSQIWWGHMDTKDTKVWKVLLNLFCPVLLISFRNPQSRWFQFWSAPVTTFWGNVLMYFLFLLLFAYVLLVDFKPPPPSGPSITEYLLYFWVFTFICEEIRQAFFFKGMTLHQRMRLYMHDMWNKCDLTAIILFIIGLICRMFESSYESGRCVLCIDYMVFTLRLFHIFAIHREMGPKLIIVWKMMKDVSFFLFFLVVWLMAYGVANQALLYSYDPNPNRIFRRVFYRPYLYIFGHLPVEELDVGERWDMACTDNVTQIEGGAEPCRNLYSNWLVIILLVVYLLVTNILLINLLIAILSNTFSKVQEHSDIYWRSQRYKLIAEYSSRPTLAPPFIILSYLVYLFLWLVMRETCMLHSGLIDQVDGGKQTFDDSIRLNRWEAVQKENFLKDQIKIQRSSDSEGIKRISFKVDRVDSKLKQLTEQLTETRDFDQRLKQMENALSQILDTLAKAPWAKP